MGKVILIFGVGDFAEILYEKLNSDAIPVSAFTVDPQFVTRDVFLRKPVIPYDRIRAFCAGHDADIYMGSVFHHHMFEAREKIFLRLLADGYGLPNYISPRASVTARKIGCGNIFMENVVIESHCVIGDGNLFWPNTVLPHHNRVGNYNNISPSVSFSGYAQIGNRCLIGNNAVLNNHAVVRDRALVGAGAYVRHEVEEEQVLVPAESYILRGRKAYEFR